METRSKDFYAAPVETERLLDAITDYQVELVRAWGRMPDVDALLLTDDWGTQEALMISPVMWRRIFAGRYRRLCDEAHRSGLLVVFHSCGNVFEIIGDLIEAGVDVIDPLQPEVMDLLPWPASTAARSPSAAASAISGWGSRRRHRCATRSGG